MTAEDKALDVLSKLFSQHPEGTYAGIEDTLTVMGSWSFLEYVLENIPDELLVEMAMDRGLLEHVGYAHKSVDGRRWQVHDKISLHMNDTMAFAWLNSSNPNVNTRLPRIHKIIREWWDGDVPMNVALSEIKQIIEEENNGDSKTDHGRDSSDADVRPDVDRDA